MKPAEDQIEPGGETVVTVTARDALGGALPHSEVALLVIDESVLALTCVFFFFFFFVIFFFCFVLFCRDYKLGHPLNSFYPPRNALELKKWCSRDSVMIEIWKKNMKKFNRSAAALKIQKIFRGFRDRKVYKKMLQEYKLKKLLEEKALKAKQVI